MTDQTILRITDIENADSSHYWPSYDWEILVDGSGPLYRVEQIDPPATEDEEFDGEALRDGEVWEHIDGEWMKPTGLTCASADKWIESVDDELTNTEGLSVGDLISVDTDYFGDGLWDNGVDPVPTDPAPGVHGIRDLGDDTFEVSAFSADGEVTVTLTTWDLQYGIQRVQELADETAQQAKRGIFTHAMDSRRVGPFRFTVGKMTRDPDPGDRPKLQIARDTNGIGIIAGGMRRGIILRAQVADAEGARRILISGAFEIALFGATWALLHFWGDRR